MEKKKRGHSHIKLTKSGKYELLFRDRYIALFNKEEEAQEVLDLLKKYVPIAYGRGGARKGAGRPKKTKES